MIAFHDLETRSRRDIKHGTWAYGEGADVMLWAYAIGDGPVRVWDITSGEPMPDDLAAALADPACIHVWHNGGMFDLPVLKLTMGITFDLARVHDTLVIALAHGLPGSLGQLCDIFRLPVDQAKSKDGKRLIRLFCIPRKDGGFNDAASHPELWQAFKQYAALDIVSMRELYGKLPKWNMTETERRLWIADQAINARGFAVDIDLVTSAIAAIDTEQLRLTTAAQDLTDGAVMSTTQRDKLLAYVTAVFGIEPEDLRASTVEKILADVDLPGDLRELLSVRLQATTSSTAKYKALHRSVSSDGRLRGTKQFCGASRTSRWAGRQFQPDNLPRPSLEHAEIETGIEALKLGCADLIVPNVMELCSSALRGCIVAPEGKHLAVADLNAIEGRVLAWLAGEQWKLDAYAEGQDLYKVTAGRILGKAPEDITKKERQEVGKVSELALGFGGGPGAFATFAQAYGIDIDQLADTARRTLAPSVVSGSGDAWEWMQRENRDTLGLSKETWIGIDAIKRAWRLAHPAIASFWKDLEDAARAAIARPGDAFTAGRVSFLRNAAWLRMVLPSGRSICYPAIRADDDGVSYMGTNQYSRRWERIRTYSGKLSENATQAVARDVLAHGLLLAEESGFRPILHVHDEIIAENCTAEELASIMSTQPAWAEGLPLDAEGFECARYRK
jgi:DNA polymerase